MTTEMWKCNVCHQTKKGYSSTDMNGEINDNGESTGGQGTGWICPACAKAEGMVNCRRCHEMRYPENTVELIDRPGHYCVGCADEIEEGDE